MKKIKTFALLSASILSLVINTSVAFANDNVTEPKLIEQSIDEWLTYMDKETEVASKYIIHHNNRMYFDFDKAQNDGVSGEALDIGLEIERVSEEHMEGKFTPGTYFRSISIPVYGNYCGPGHSGNNFTLPAIDHLDWGCMQHDQCYKPWSPGENCACNRQLINFIQTNRRWMPSSAIPTANAIKYYFEKVGLIGC
ncbi:phospholipase [Streptococcus halichoeri]|uniref:phospholipase n=1 Tax=Streptococcus halichoeri TaxID=254785 RepID=UPI0013575A98|nr:phospholipase [Streptococcus halichoeri]